jgi:hypothetical protein
VSILVVGVARVRLPRRLLLDLPQRFSECVSDEFGATSRARRGVVFEPLEELILNLDQQLLHLIEYRNKH